MRHDYDFEVVSNADATARMVCPPTANLVISSWLPYQLRSYRVSLKSAAKRSIPDFTRRSYNNARCKTSDTYLRQSKLNEA